MKFNFNDYKYGELYTKFGITSTHFMPFDEDETKPYNPNCGLTEQEYLEEMQRYRQSTVYQGIRYFFETPEKLKPFCEMVESEKL